MTGEKLQGRWSLLHERCIHCKRIDRPHMAKGFCANCYNYHRDIVNEKAKRKAKRIEQGIVEKRYPKVRAWHEANAERVREYKREWHKKHGPKPKWTVGMTVWRHCGSLGWCHGTIVEVSESGKTLWVQIRGFKCKTSGKNLRDHDPEIRERLAAMEEAA